MLELEVCTQSYVGVRSTVCTQSHVGAKEDHWGFNFSWNRLEQLWFTVYWAILLAIFFFTFQNCPRAVYADKQHTEGGGSAQPGSHPLHPGAEGWGQEQKREINCLNKK